MSKKFYFLRRFSWADYSLARVEQMSSVSQMSQIQFKSGDDQHCLPLF